jgi:hypothetical protein
MNPMLLLQLHYCGETFWIGRRCIVLIMFSLIAFELMMLELTTSQME